MIHREEEHVRLLKEQTRNAVSLAMSGEWAEAARLNREILEAAPDDVGAMNRLGKALAELGESGQALDAFRRALELSPGNPIAAKNVERLMAATSSGCATARRSCGGGTVKPRMFIADSGKSAEVSLLASTDAGNPSPGTPVTLEGNGSTLGVMDPDANCLGLVPPGMAHRLLSLIAGGNCYEGAVSGTTNGAVRVVLREAYQHPNQRAKVSFPAAAAPVVDVPLLPALAAIDAPDTTPVNVPEVPLSLLDDSPELAAVGAGIGIFDDALLPDLPEDDE